MKIDLYGISLEYTEPWDLHFTRPPTFEVGGFELILKERHQIRNVLCVLWRPCDQPLIDSLSQMQLHKSGLMEKFLVHVQRKGSTNQGQKILNDIELVEKYCDRIYQNLQKEQGKISFVFREEVKKNGHAAELSEFGFPISKRREKIGEMHRLQLVLKCDVTSRFVAAYSSADANLFQEYKGLTKEIIQSLNCHGNDIHN